MAAESEGVIDGQKALSMFGVAAAAVIGFTVQPMLAIADPVALLITGFLIVISALGLAAVLVAGELSSIADTFFQIILYSAMISMGATTADAWSRRRAINETCAKLQHIMLYEHRHRTDVPDIFRTLGCKAQ